MDYYNYIGVKILNLEHLPVQCREQAAGAEENRTLGQHGASLIHPVKVTSGHISHTNRSCRAIHELIAIPIKHEQLIRSKLA